MSSKPFIIVGMSGGVDSSVTAMLLQEQGYRVEGLFMKNWEETDDVAYCTAKEDMEDAMQVCDTLEIPLHQINFSKKYWDNVFTHFLNEYKAGRTPNPDVMCNKEIKFKAFLDYALKLGADKIATGHYARIKEVNKQYQMLKGIDDNKDQSYFLCELGQQELSRSLFPLGDLPKPKVRELATQAGFDNHTKKDSTGICFIGERKFRDFLSTYLPATPGDIITLEGDVIGQHQGSLYYTIGQRQGLGIGGLQDTDEIPWYVAAKNVENNTVTVVQGHDHPALQATHLTASNINWIAGSAPESHFKCQAKIRYRQAQQACTVDIQANGSARVIFDQPQRAVTEGQSVVFYDNEICLGGGIIQSSHS